MNNTLNQLRELHCDNPAEVEQDLTWLSAASNHHILFTNDPNYPPLLKQINNPPKALYIIGELATLSAPQIAMVGSRNPSPTGEAIAAQLAAELADAGFVVTSGLALGVDAASHRGCLDAGRPTIAVLGNGLKHIYPRRHAALADAITERGALVSEFPLTMQPLKMNFPRRNRIISGLSLGTVVVEATPRSGSLITARLAVEQNREVFAVPGSIHNPLSKGCHLLIQQGAKLVESYQDIIAELAPWQRKRIAMRHQQSHQQLDPGEQKLIECIGFEPTSIDQLVARSGYSAAEVATMLLNLELQGYIKASLGGAIRVTP